MPNYPNTIILMIGTLVVLVFVLWSYMRRYLRATNAANAKLELRTNELASSDSNLRLRTGELASSNSDLELRTGELASSNIDLELRTGELASSSSDLGLRTDELATSNTDLIKSNNYLKQRTKELASSNTELTQTNIDLKQRTEEVALSNAELGRLTIELASANLELEERVNIRTSELRLLNTELSEAKDFAQAASKLKSEFVATMSHEIRTPLNAVIGMSNVLLKTVLSRKQLIYANSIKQAGDSLLFIVNDILDFSKIESGKLDLEVGDFDPVWLVESVAELFAVQARDKDISLITFIDPNLPLRLMGDPERLRQMLTNFLSNALKFSTEGAIVMRADLESIHEPNLRVRFSVRDHGIGLTPAQQERLFEPFAQADSTITRKYGGTGLGLSICKRLAELMEGSIGVDSEEGCGSVFYFTVPLGNCSTVTSLPTAIDLDNVRTLVINNEPSACKIFSSYISAWGLRVDTADSAIYGMRLLKEAQLAGDPFRTAIVDLTASNDDTPSFIKAIAKEPLINDTPLIILTAIDAYGLLNLATNTGVTRYLAKPVKQAELLDCLLSVLSNERPVNTRSPWKAKAGARAGGHRVNRSEIILVAEDHPINQQVAQLYLDDLGFACHMANNGREVLQGLSSGAYALVLMDCQMPEMDGFAATTAIRRNELQKGGRIPIIAMTGNAVKGDREKCLAAGMDDYLSKPVDPHQLKAMLQKWLPLNKLSVNSPDRTENENVKVDDPTQPSRFSAKLLSLRVSTPSAFRMLSIFVKQMPLDMQKLHLAVSTADAETLEITAHSLRSVFSVIGANDMTERCWLLEKAAHEHSWDLIDEKMQDFENNLELLLSLVTKELDVMAFQGV